jgi:hypothetical protein
MVPTSFRIAYEYWIDEGTHDRQGVIHGRGILEKGSPGLVRIASPPELSIRYVKAVGQCHAASSRL